MIVKIAEVAAMASARVSTATAVKPGVAFRRRAPIRRSLIESAIEDSGMGSGLPAACQEANAVFRPIA